MPSDFNTIRKLYDDGRFVELLHHPNGIFWLKLRSISRAEQIRQFCQILEINTEGIQSRQLFEHVYNHKPDNQVLEQFIRELFQHERAERKRNEDYIISQLYQMKVFDWGGLYQNSLEQTIVDNYIKKIQSWDTLNFAIENEIHISMRGYVQCSWYNHWSSILIEDIFKDYPAILPAMGLVKKVDFFIHNFPFDLKVTYFPDGYTEVLRRAEGLRPELTLLKAFCRQQDIWFDNNKPAGVLFPELFAKLTEHPSQAAQDFIADFKATRMRLLQLTIDNPQALKVWLYENQGIRRFDASNRFFLILVDAEDFDESWKLKRNKDLLVNSIYSHLDVMSPDTMENLRLVFQWENENYETYADILFVVVNQR
jgi:hypothetical protein